MFSKVLVTIIALKINLSKILFNKALPSYLFLLYTFYLVNTTLDNLVSYYLK